MRMTDGGYRPAHTLHFATDTGSRVNVGTDVTTAGTDHGRLAPMIDQIDTRHQQLPAATLVDGGFGTKEDLGLDARDSCS